MLSTCSFFQPCLPLPKDAALNHPPLHLRSRCKRTKEEHQSCWMSMSRQGSKKSKCVRRGSPTGRAQKLPVEDQDVISVEYASPDPLRATPGAWQTRLLSALEHFYFRCPHPTAAKCGFS